LTCACVPCARRFGELMTRSRCTANQPDCHPERSEGPHKDSPVFEIRTVAISGDGFVILDIHVSGFSKILVAMVRSLAVSAARDDTAQSWRSQCNGEWASHTAAASFRCGTSVRRGTIG
jgi:hypothetical protein